MKALFRAIQSVPGVQGSLVCDNHGQALGAYGMENVDASVLDNAGLQVAQTLAAIEEHLGRVRDIEYGFERRSLLVRDLGNAFLIVVCTPNVDAALLRMTLNIAASLFEKDAALQNHLKAAAQSRADASGWWQGVKVHA